MRIERGAYIVDVNVKKTKELYQALPERDAGRAPEGYYERVDKAPEALAKFLRSLGVDIAKPAQMTRYHVLSGEMEQYGGSFHLAGVYAAGLPEKMQVTDEGYAFRCGESTLYFNGSVSALPEGFPQDALQLEVIVWLPCAEDAWDEMAEYPEDIAAEG